MDPYSQQPQNTLQPPTHNPYDFILNPQQQPKPKRLVPGSGSSFGLTIALIVGGALLLMVILAVVANLLGGSKANTADFASLAQTQQELIRISHQGTADAVHQTTKNLAVTAEYSMRSQQQKTITYLAQHGKKLGEKELVLKQNAQTDLQFRTAKSTSTFDLVFSQIMQNQLTAYANSLKQLHNTTTSKTEREALATYYEQTQLLISQVPYTQDSIEGADQ